MTYAEVLELNHHELEVYGKTTADSLDQVNDIVLGAHNLDGDIEYELALCEVSGTCRFSP
jgi:hypothetical protein